MKHLITRLALALTCVAIEAGAATAAPASWVIRQGVSEIWILSDAVIASADDIPPEWRRILATSTEVWFEGAEGGDPNEVQRFIAEQGSDEQTELFSQLSSPAAAHLEQVIRDHGLKRESFVHAKPWWAYLQLNSLQGELMRKAGVVTVERALKREAPTPAVPTRFEYASRLALLQAFAALPADAQTCAVGWQLDRIEQFKAETDAVMRAWSAGDNAYFDGFISALNRRCPGVGSMMVTDRNAAWMPRIKAMLQKPGHYVLILGQGHMTSDPRGMPALLRAEGIEAQPR